LSSALLLLEQLSKAWTALLPFARAGTRTSSLLQCFNGPETSLDVLEKNTLPDAFALAYDF